MLRMAGALLIEKQIYKFSIESIENTFQKKAESGSNDLWMFIFPGLAGTVAMLAGFCSIFWRRGRPSLCLIVLLPKASLAILC